MTLDHPPSTVSPTRSVLVVEDTAEFRQLLRSLLEAEGYRVTVVGTGSQALTEGRLDDPDVIVLDLRLPDMDGIEVCRQLRTFTEAYIIMVTARDHEIDRVVGLSFGADDYVVKPFSPRELAARIQAMLRRPRSAPSQQPHPDVHVFDGLTVDVRAREVRVDGCLVALTKIEFDLLDALSGQSDMVFSREMLIDHVWGSSWYGDGRIVDVHIANLRRKIDLGGYQWVKTVRGVGYRLNVS
ncbi:MAG: response regulator transcription factor [Actinomycetota bacterium]|nr:response regulator transcription factor [Actinomycetota bacterium]